MKTLIVAAAGTLALMAGSAYAGGCSYGKHMAEASEKTPVMAEVDAAEADRLAKLKALEEQAALDKLIETPVMFN